MIRDTGGAGVHEYQRGADRTEGLFQALVTMACGRWVFASVGSMARRIPSSRPRWQLG